MKRDDVHSAAAPGAAIDASVTPRERQDLYDRMRPAGLTPLWEVLHALVPQQPAVRTRPAHWRWSDVEPFLQDAGRLITAEEAIRRVLILENPGWRGESRSTGTLYAGLQLILPGEVAPSHRHTQSALRFVVDGDGAYTAVNGERTIMHPGDFIITPHWTWHDHGNEGSQPVVWLDGLDIPVVAFFESGFAENDSARSQAVTAAEGTSLARFGASMLPLKPHSPFGATSPIFCYPYARSREALAHLAAHAGLDPAHGAALRYVNPLTGGWAIPTIATQLQLLPEGFETRTSRTTAGTVFSVVEGSATVTITCPAQGPGAGTPMRYRVGAKDHFVVPPWAGLQLSAADECVLFSFSDAPLQQAAGILRVQED
ncbi:MAG: gentisate 1,2-dioxygenase [Lautropia sp.]|nr:gentisate 1,2-dioxygenase [Lautropia sp.]